MDAFVQYLTKKGVPLGIWGIPCPSSRVQVFQSSCDGPEQPLNSDKGCSSKTSFSPVEASVIMLAATGRGCLGFRVVDMEFFVVCLEKPDRVS